MSGRRRFYVWISRHGRKGSPRHACSRRSAISASPVSIVICSRPGIRTVSAVSQAKIVELGDARSLREIVEVLVRWRADREVAELDLEPRAPRRASHRTNNIFLCDWK